MESPVLDVVNVRKKYGTLVALEGAHLAVEDGEILGLLGPNGAGKTTTLRVLMGLTQPTAGEIYVFGHRLVPGSPVLSRIGALVEGPGFLPHLSGLDNLKAYWRATGRPWEDAHFDERHDLLELLKACDTDRLGEAGRARLRAPIQTIHLLWTNSLRFAHEAMTRNRLHAMQLDRGFPRNADPLKSRCTELWDACSEVVTVGEERWT